MSSLLAAAALAVAAPIGASRSEVCIVYFEPRIEVVALSGVGTASVVAFDTPPRSRDGVVFGDGLVGFGSEHDGAWLWTKGSDPVLIQENGSVVGQRGSMVVVRARGGEVIEASASGSRAGSPGLGVLRYVDSGADGTTWSWFELGTGIVIEGGGGHAILRTGSANLYRVNRLGPSRFFAVARFQGQVQVWLVEGLATRRLWMSAPDRGDAYVDSGGNTVVLRYIESGKGVATAVSRVSHDGKATRIALLPGEFIGVDLDASDRYLCAVRLDRSHGGNPMVRVDLTTGRTTTLRNWVDVAFVLRDEGGWIFE